MSRTLEITIIIPGETVKKVCDGAGCEIDDLHALLGKILTETTHFTLRTLGEGGWKDGVSDETLN